MTTSLLYGKRVRALPTCCSSSSDIDNIDDQDDDDDAELLLSSDTDSNVVDEDSCSTWSCHSDSDDDDSSDSAARVQGDTTTSAAATATVCARRGNRVRDATVTTYRHRCATLRAVVDDDYTHTRTATQTSCACASRALPCAVVRVTAQWHFRLRRNADNNNNNNNNDADYGAATTSALPRVISTTPLQLSCCLREVATRAHAARTRATPTRTGAATATTSAAAAAEVTTATAAHAPAARVLVGRALLHACLDATPLATWALHARALQRRVFARVSRQHACVVLYYRAMPVTAATASSTTSAYALRSYDVIGSDCGCNVRGVPLQPHQRYHFACTTNARSAAAMSTTCVIDVEVGSDCTLQLRIGNDDIASDAAASSHDATPRGTTTTTARRTCATPTRAAATRRAAPPTQRPRRGRRALAAVATTAVASACTASDAHDSGLSSLSSSLSTLSSSSSLSATTLAVYTTGIVVERGVAEACRQIGVCLNPPLSHATHARVLVARDAAPLQRSVKLLTALCCVDAVVSERWLRELLRRTAPHRRAAAAAASHNASPPHNNNDDDSNVRHCRSNNGHSIDHVDHDDDDTSTATATRAIVASMLTECAAYAHREPRSVDGIEATHHFALHALLRVPPSTRQALLRGHVVYVHPHTTPQQPPLNDVRRVLTTAGAVVCAQLTSQTTTVVMPRRQCDAACWRALACGTRDGDDVDDNDGSVARNNNSNNVDAAATWSSTCRVSYATLLFVVVDDVFRCVLQQRPLQPPSSVHVPRHVRR